MSIQDQQNRIAPINPASKSMGVIHNGRRTTQRLPQDLRINSLDLSQQVLLIACVAELFDCIHARAQGEVVQAIGVGAELVGLSEPADLGGYFGGVGLADGECWACVSLCA